MEILCFHRVLQERSALDEPYFMRGTAISQPRFVEMLDERVDRRFVDEDEATGLLFGPPERHRDVCWLTFDDGYADTFEVAAEELARRGIRGSLFMSSSALDPEWHYPVDRWYAALNGATQTIVELEGFGCPARTIDLSRAEDRASLVAGPEKSAFVAANPLDQTSLIDRLRALLEARDVAMPRLLDRAQLGALAERGWKIGGHGRSHRALSGVPEALLSEEVGGSTACFDPEHRSDWFAWPDGRCDPNSVFWLSARAQEFGIRGALVLEDGVADARIDPFRVGRVLAR